MKKFFRMVMALTLVGGVLAFSGCTDYEDDINALDDRVTALESTVAELQEQVSSGVQITGVETIENGVRVTLSNGMSFDLTNGAAGAGSVVTIGENGNWYIDGEDTGMPSRGEAGADAPTVYYVPGTEGDEEGFWVKVTEEEGKEPVREATDITWLPEGTITAVWDETTQTLTIYNAEGADGEPVVITASTGMVTSVELVRSYSSTTPATADQTLTFSSIIENENTFAEKGPNGETLTGKKIEFVKGQQSQRDGSFLVRVSPANAVLTADMISLVNSKGENLDDFVTVGEPERYEGLLTRAAVNSGIWEVPVSLKNYTPTTFAAKQLANPSKGNVAGNRILYAVQVNNTADSDAERYVTSSYDLTLAYEAYLPVSELNFFVDDQNVNDLNNRASFSDNKSLEDYSGTATAPAEYVWSSDAAVAPITEGANQNVTPGDDRHDKDVFLAVQGEDITVTLKEKNNDGNYVNAENIRAMYVTLDWEGNAVESAPSEWNAWTNYTYTGLNTIVEGTSLKFSINDESTINDYIGFRVFAVNYDGTLVDPDGRAFYVKVGDQATDWGTVNTTIIPDAFDGLQPDEKSADAALTIENPVSTAGGLKAAWTDMSGTTPAAPKFNVVFKAGSSEIFSTADMDFSKITDEVNFDDVTAVYTQPTVTAWTDLEDDKAYYGTLTITNEEGFTLATITVSMTKKLPTEVPGFTVKTSQLVNGVYNCYLVPDSWTYNSATAGTMPMSDVFNFEGEPSQYRITFANAGYDTEKKTITDNTVDGDGTLEVPNLYPAANLIDNQTQHATTVSFDFGMISSKKDANGNYVNTVLSAGAGFQTVFNCIYNDTYTWHWATREDLVNAGYSAYSASTLAGYTYEVPSPEAEYGSDFHVALMTGTTPTQTNISIEEIVFGVSAWDGLYNARLSASYNGSLGGLQLTDGTLNAKLITDANGEINEYFTPAVDAEGIYLKFNADSSNPTAEVPSTLVLTYLDMYGHPVDVEIPITVLPRR